MTYIINRWLLSEILTPLSPSKTFMPWKWAEPTVSARSRLRGLFQLFYQPLKISTFFHQWAVKHTNRLRKAPTSRFLQKRRKITILAPFSAIKPCEPCPKWPNHPYGIKRHFAALKPGNLRQHQLPQVSKRGLCPQAHHRGNWLNISLQILSPAALPVETFKYRPDRQSKGPRPSRQSRPGPLLDFAEPGRLPRVIDGRLRRGKRISRRNILPQRQTIYLAL